MNIGIIGTGNIATSLLENISKDKGIDGKVVAVFGRNKEKGELLKAAYAIEFYTDFNAFMESEMDVVVEAATIEVVGLYLKCVVERKKDVVISSIGAFKEDAYLSEMKSLAQSNGVQIYLPSGAIGGLDLIQSANALNGLKRVQITTKKSPISLGLENVSEEKLLFDGSAREAIEKFPKNVNVALLLSIAGLGTEKTKVKVIADPVIEKNTHVIEAEGDFGKMHLQIENNPMSTNPKTSYLAALSILSTLKNKENSFRIGS
ncbi:aspartate dehydrogenase [Sporosarcina sp. CAU 1771]